MSSTNMVAIGTRAELFLSEENNPQAIFLRLPSIRLQKFRCIGPELDFVPSPMILIMDAITSNSRSTIIQQGDLNTCVSSLDRQINEIKLWMQNPSVSHKVWYCLGEALPYLLKNC